MIVVLAALFGAAAAAPLLYRAARVHTGWLLALIPGSACVWFATADVSAMREQVRWMPTLGVDITLKADGLSTLMALLITGIGALILVYASAYLRDHPRLGRFYLYLLLFMAAMLGIVLSDNLLLLFLFWELTSISSFMLIGFEQERPPARTSALQALLVTGAGGLALLAGALMLGTITGSYDISALAAHDVRGHELYLPALLLVLFGAFTKSAQAPFHFWLPNAMEAPTPVSAYLHSSTMVKAGVYLLARLQPSLGDTMPWTALLVVTGGVTAVLGAVLAWRGTEIKRVLAYSTVSALGLMVLLIGIGSDLALRAAAAFLLAHALYKGALFMMAGNLIHGTGATDLRSVSGLRRSLPITAAVALIAGLSMAGAPPLGGFLAKELVLEALLEEHGWLRAVAAAGFVTSFLLSAVAVTVAWQPFTGPERAPNAHPHEVSFPMWIGPATLAGAGMVMGLMPSLFATPLVDAAAAAMGRTAEGPPLALWHGVNLTLLIGLAVLTAGVVFGLRRHRSVFTATVDSRPRGADAVYHMAIRALLNVAGWVSQALQPGGLQHYLRVTVVATTALVGITLLVLGGVPRLPAAEAVPLYEIVLLMLILAGAIATIFVRSRLGAVAAMGIVGYSVALIYISYGAPDLAMTQFVVETLTLILLLLAFHHLPATARPASGGARLRDAVVSVSAGILMTVLLLVVLAAPELPSISEYFLERSFTEGHGRNVVNVILVDFRALDTLGEISVLAMAGVGVYGLLRLRPASSEHR